MSTRRSNDDGSLLIDTRPDIHQFHDVVISEITIVVERACPAACAGIDCNCWRCIRCSSRRILSLLVRERRAAGLIRPVLARSDKGQHGRVATSTTRFQ